MTRSRPGLVLVALGVTLAACGVQEDAGPRRIEPDSVPFGLLAPTLQSSSTTVGPGTLTSQVRIFLVDDRGRLVEVVRRVEGTPSVTKALQALLGGASQTEANARLASAVAAGTDLLDVDVSADGTASVDLSEDVLSVTGRRQIQAIAQIVFTATGVAPVERIRFRFEGKARDVPRGDGQLTSSALTRGDFRDLVGGDGS